MTAYAIDIRRDLVTVAADTLGYVPDTLDAKPMGFINKVVSLPNIKSVIFGRGQHWIVAHAAVDLMMMSGCQSIEDAVAILPDMLRRITARYAEVIGFEGDTVDLVVLELSLAGYSDTEKRMRFFQFASYQDYVLRDEEDGNYCGPIPWPLLPAQFHPAPSSASLPTRMVEMIKAIDAYFVAEPVPNHGQRVGGEIVLTEVTPTGISQRTIYKFASFEQTKQAGAAVLARLVRGDLDGLAAVRNGLTHADDAVLSETGQALRPSADVLPHTPPLNRQARRAAERAAQKGRAA